MKKHKILSKVFMLLIVLTCIQVTSATSVFLTSDHVGSQSNDLNMMNSVKEYIEEITDGQIEVIIDPYAPSPGEGTRAIESSADVSVNFAASDGGNFLILAKALRNIDKQIIFVNMGDFDLDNENFIRRAWDDNYSSDYYAGINSPGQFLNKIGIEYIQPVIAYPNNGESYTQSNDETNRYIAQQIVEKIDQKTDNKYYDESLIVTHNLHPSQMAQASKEILESTEYTNDQRYNSYTAPQVLYMTSSYLNGNGLTEPLNYDLPNSPLETSILSKDSYSVYDYMKMGSIVKNYMDENNKAPDYINYEGAYIAYPDLVYNFAKITENHTSSSHMDFASNYQFDKLNHSLLIDSLPLIIVGVILLGLIGIIRHIKAKRRRRRRR